MAGCVEGPEDDVCLRRIWVKAIVLVCCYGFMVQGGQSSAKVVTGGNLTAMTGDSVTFHCEVRNDSKITLVEWTRCDRGMAPSQVLIFMTSGSQLSITDTHQGRVTMTTASSFTLRNVSMEDFGLYCCKLNVFPDGVLQAEVHLSEGTEEGDQNPTLSALSPQVVYILGGVLCALVLVVVMTTVVVYKKHRVQLNISVHQGSVSKGQDVAAEENDEGAEQNIKGSEENIKGVEENIKGAEENIKGAEENIKSAEENIKSAEENIKGAEENIKGAEENIKSSEENIKGAEEIDQLYAIPRKIRGVKKRRVQLRGYVNVEVHQGSVPKGPDDAGEENIKDVEENIKSAEENIKDVQENIKSAVENIKGVEENIKDTEENIKGREENIKSVQENIKGREENIKSVQENIKDIEENIKSVQENIKGREENIKSVQENIKGREENIKSVQENIKGREENIKSVQENIKGREENIKSAEESDQLRHHMPDHVEGLYHLSGPEEAEMTTQQHAT